MNFNDVMMVESAEGHEAESETEYFSAMQRQINGGCWSLQGAHGRAMMDAISEGRCLLGKDRATDYYGNVIPARDDVMEGTKGSVEFVADAMGAEWSSQMAAL